jgi:pyrimidine-nucleoside phosphorylase
MNVQELILKKRDGLEMADDEIEFLVKGISDGSIPDYQISAWAMAVYFRGMSKRETHTLSLAMARSGEVLDLSEVEGVAADKHSTGGVGDKATMVVIPLVAAAGIPVAKMSGRGLGFTGGTIDKFESIPGFLVEMTHRQFIEQINRIKVALISQSGNLVPADKRLYALRDVTATVDSIPLIASSIMSKKIAAGAQAIVLDVKVGRGAFMKTVAEAEELARTMVEIGQGAGRRVTAVLTDMSQPLGCAVGNALEVKEVIDTLQGNGPDDLKELSIALAAHMLLLTNTYATLPDAVAKTKQLLFSGAAYEKFMEMVRAQHGVLQQTGDYGLPRASLQVKVKATQTGYVREVDAEGWAGPQ